MQSQDLSTMTVVQLRKLARENGVKLSAGIDKEGIVARLKEAGKEAELTPAVEHLQQEQLQKAPLSADVTSVAPSSLGHQPWQASHAQNTSNEEKPREPVYRQAWQARTNMPRQPVRQPGWQSPQRVGGATSRFGPPVNYTKPDPDNLAEQEEQRDSTSRQAPPQQLDGYRLGYQAAPPRNQYGRQEGGRGGYRSESNHQRSTYQQSAPAHREEYFNDGLYKPMLDPSFGQPYNGAQPLPDLFQAGNMEEASGVLEILPDGYGFLRANTLLPGKSDIYVSVAQIRRYGLRTGDHVEGKARPQRNSDKFSALLYVESLNGRPPESKEGRRIFEEMTPVYPTRRIVLESAKNQNNMPIRMLDLIAPIGFGQRAMVIAPPESGRLLLLREIGKAIKQNDAKAHVMLLLVDTAPEEVTEIREGLDVEVFASTFTEAPESQARASETMLESAQRLVEDGRDVVILLDSLTKLTRAYQASLTQGGRAMTNTVTPAALVRPKRFFGMARNTREGGSLTVIATIAVDTGSRVDDIIFEEFKGTANMEVRLCTRSAGDLMFPMLDLKHSGTKKDSLLLNDEEKEGLRAIHTMLGSISNREAVAQLADMMQKTKGNADLFNRLKDWLSMWEKAGNLGKKG